MIKHAYCRHPPGATGYREGQLGARCQGALTPARAHCRSLDLIKKQKDTSVFRTPISRYSGDEDGYEPMGEVTCACELNNSEIQ